MEYEAINHQIYCYMDLDQDLFLVFVLAICTLLIPFTYPITKSTSIGQVVPTPTSASSQQRHSVDICYKLGRVLALHPPLHIQMR